MLRRLPALATRHTNSLRTMSTAPKDIYVAVQDNSLVSSAAQQSAAEVAQLWKDSRAKEKDTRTFYNVGGQGKTVVAVGVGKAKERKGGEGEENALKEQARKAAAVATHALKAASSKSFAIDPLDSPHSAAVGATLASFVWNLKTTSEAKAKLEPVEISLLGDKAEPSLESEKAKDGRIQLDWETGKVYGEAQNLARVLMETPANRMTPTIFCETAKKQFQGVENVSMEAHDLKWAEEKKMGSFISVSRGSDEPLRFLELRYNGAANKDEAPLAFVGKGITFDSGGISLKPGAGMKEMRADMGGAATTLSAAWAIAKLKIPINLVLCIPLTENMPSGKATKPGDVVVASNGVTIEVDNTDAEGRLALADALYYASSQYKPHTVVDVATLTGAMMIALGNQFTGVFTNSDSLWSELDAAGSAERDRVWRMPLDEGYMPQINYTGMDLCNTGGRLGGSCTAAIFLKRFVDGLIVDGSDNENQDGLIRWAHLDIAGVMDLARSDGGYNLGGMTGRPVRTLIEFARRSVKA
ncbi:Cytosol aminopeptidase family, catalytic domain-domain containing protein [Rhodotorula toruloides]|uniref:Cytosol aminopeptidase family, catalytic domain-domain containing protein n=1 Tax=Rhodotorula toruloides TaxID=5286 RepID=A0A2T0AFA6_RHOTO|nr:Cytosol aminopeptidase family, catalytic domain-domain containing protein [Rhodotorula toruloides]PRQ76678.1 Cytosol aminopeptidase family, catalytic domain-domain containing protein [Rhodotorula toruloides]